MASSKTIIKQIEAWVEKRLKQALAGIKSDYAGIVPYAGVSAMQNANVPDGTIGGVTHYGWRTMQEIVEDAGGDYDNTYVEIPDITGTDADKADIKWINPDFEDKDINITWDMLYSILNDAVFRTTVTDPDSLMSEETVHYPVLFTDSEGNEYFLVAEQIGIPAGFRPRWVNVIYIFRTNPKEGGGAELWVADATDGTFKFSSEAYSNNSQEFYSAMAQHKNMNWLKTYVNNVIAALESRADEVGVVTDEVKAIIKAMFYRLFTCPAPMSRTLHIRESGKWTNIQNTIPFDTVEEMQKYTAKDGDIGVVDNWSWVEVTDDNTDEWAELPLVDISGTMHDKGTAKSHIFYCKDTFWEPAEQEYPNINDFEHAGVFIDTNGKIWTLALANTYSVLNVFSDIKNNINYFPVWLFDFDPNRRQGNPVEGDTGTVKLFLCSLGDVDIDSETTSFNNFLGNLNAHLEYPVDWFNDAYCLASGNYTFFENDGWIADGNSVYARPSNFPNIINMIDEETSAFTDGVTVVIGSFVSDFFNNLDMGIHLPKHTKGSYEMVNDEWKERGSSENALLTPITYAELVDLRNNGELVPGALYRITDYVTTTAQENTQSAGHQFDVIVRALDGSTLSEEAYAIQHDGDEYFANSKLEAWKVWYCLDNDKNRFAWADDGIDETTEASMNGLPRMSSGDKQIGSQNYYCWGQPNTPRPTYTTSLNPEIGDITYSISSSMGGGYSVNNKGTVESFTPDHEGTGLPNGKGVIYRLIDEFNNDIKYDFKNIQFKRTITEGAYDEEGDDTWCYTLNVWHKGMCQDASIVGNTLPNDDDFVSGVYNNKFGYATAYDLSLAGVDTFAFALGNNVLLSLVEDDGYYGTFSNIVGDNFYLNTIGSSFHSNSIGNYVYDNLINIYFDSNTIGNHFRGNTIGPGFEANTIGNHFVTNIIGDDFHLNTIGHKFVSNTIGNYVHDNIVGNNFHSSIIGNYFTHNTIGNDFDHNTIGTMNGDTATTKDYVRYISVEDGVEYVDITTSATTSLSAYLQNIIIGKGVAGTFSSRKTITHPTVNDAFQTTYLPTGSTEVNV